MGRYPYAAECKKLKERIKELEAENERLMLWIDYYGISEKVKKGGKS